MQIDYSQINNFDAYLENSLGIFSKLKLFWNKTLAFFKTKNPAIYDDEFERKVNSLKQSEESHQELLNIIEAITKKVIESNKEEISLNLINESDESDEFVPPTFKDVRKEVFKKVSKGFIPSATFYPAYKMFQQFFMILNKEIEFKDISINLNSSELMAIISFIFVYFFYKLIKETYVIKKEMTEKKLKEFEHEKLRKQQIKERVKKVEQKLWSKEQMDKWIQDRLWSPEELERLIEMKINQKIPVNEDSLFDDYMNKSKSTNNIKETEFESKLETLENKTIKDIQNEVFKFIQDMSSDEINKVINLIKSKNIVTESFKDTIKSGLDSTGDKIKSSWQSIKKAGRVIAKELYPTFSFYPALQVYMVLDKGVKEGFDTLSMGDKKQLAFYLTMFIVVFGAKLAVDRINQKRLEKQEKMSTRLKKRKIVRNR